MDGVVKEFPVVYIVNNLDAYKRKVEQYLKEQSSNIIIHKLTHNIQITQDELNTLEQMLFEQGSIGTKEEFTKVYGDQPLGRFIRHILGMDINAAKLAFGEILTEQTLNGNQIQFIDTIINYLNTNGVIDPKKLFESPFTDINSGGILGLFDEKTSTKIISLIQEINQNAEVG